MLRGLFRAQRAEIIQKLVTELCESCDNVVPEETHGLDYFFWLRNELTITPVDNQSLQTMYSFRIHSDHIRGLGYVTR
jgi:hypothetical protein